MNGGTLPSAFDRSGMRQDLHASIRIEERRHAWTETAQGRRARVTGRIQEYQGAPETILKSPSQIVIVGGEKLQVDVAAGGGLSGSAV